MTDWPQVIARPKVYGNFRVKRPKKHVSAQQRREGNSEKHLAAIRKSPCCGCGFMGRCDPHHLKSGPAKEERALGRRATDRWAVPLCRTCHDLAEEAGGRGEPALFKSWGIQDACELAEALWYAPKDPAVMTNIILAHRGNP